jgi:transcriptional regulator with XRE-family HTH domain
MQDKDRGLTEEDRAVAERAKARRIELGLTVNKVAQAMGRTYQCIHGMEQTGTRSTRVAADWGKVLQCSAEWLLFGSGDPARTVSVASHVALVTVPRAMLQEAADLMDARRGRRRDLVAEIRQVLA